MAASNQICQLDTITLARAVAAKELSPVEVVEAVLERLDRLDPTLHMFTTVVPDQARKDAKRIEGDLAAGREVGPLAGCHRGQGPDLHQGDPYGLGVVCLRRLRA
jgi:aspartyl-tRNA(Asn)/glutamyl-tRNA(Gln) amidotransferase subunit A